MLNFSTFGYTAYIYTTIHFIPSCMSAYHSQPEPQQR
jgi:hypothetical protein